MTTKLKKLQAMSPLDRTIYIHVRMVGSDLALLFALSCVMLMFAIVGDWILPLSPLVLYFQYKIYRILFYDSLYGKSAYLFQALPISTEDMVRAKLFVSGTKRKCDSA